MIPQRRTQERKILSEINVTPFVDIMLVLLIIFMVTAPFLEQGIDVELPSTSVSSLKRRENLEPIRIEIRKNQDILIQGKKTNSQKFSSSLTKFGKKTAVLIYADKDLSYGFVAQLMSAIQDSGFTNLSLVTTPQTSKK
ncbi:MAG: biopolymer transporter ExbD [Deltaproteobacteria bacterium]|nr:biopolymer transporter ExbD [Deltaproteobacteria bacterium]